MKPSNFYTLPQNSGGVLCFPVRVFINPLDRNMWRSGVRSAMRAASQLSERGPTDVDVAPVPAL